MAHHTHEPSKPIIILLAETQRTPQIIRTPRFPTYMVRYAADKIPRAPHTYTKWTFNIFVISCTLYSYMRLSDHDIDDISGRHTARNLRSIQFQIVAVVLHNKFEFAKKSLSYPSHINVIFWFQLCACVLSDIQVKCCARTSVPKLKSSRKKWTF